MQRKIVRWIKQTMVGLAVAAGLITNAATAQAGTNLVVTCPAVGVCAISPSGTPLFNEAGWIPGSSVTQSVQITNTSSQNGFIGFEVYDYNETANLGEVIDINVYRGVPLPDNSNLIYGGVTLHQFRDDGYFTIDTLNATSTKSLYVVATMRDSGGPQDQYQGAMAQFSLRVGLEVAPIPPTSGGGDGSGNPGSGGGTGGSNSPASPPVCHDQVPSSAPTLRVTNVGTNTVSLSWTPVSPVTHYALVFTRTSDGDKYGSTNIGNVTSFTVTNLSGGANYRFEVFGVNGCAPGPRSNLSNTGNVPGPFIGGRPTGGGQVLGVTTASPTPSPSPSASPSPSPSPEGLVAGVTTDATCEPWRMYVPWILLILQAILVAAVEYYFRRDQGYTKYFLAAGITLLSIVLFYLLRSCPCYQTGSLWILVWLCTWYWVVSVILTILLRLFSYAFLEEVEEKVPATSVVTTESKTETKVDKVTKADRDSDSVI
jgi:hypothetical protein